MRTVMKMAGFAAAGVFAFSGAFAQAAVIDTFNVGGVNLTSDEEGEFVVETETGLDASEVLGGVRRSTVALDEGNELNLNVNIASPGFANLNSDVNSKGTFRFEYGEAADNSDLLADLTDGGVSDLFRIRFLSADADTNVTITVADNDGDTGSASEFTTGEGGFVIEFTEFDNSINFDAITSLTINVDGQMDGDYQVNFVTTAIPTPAALPAGLVLMGVCGLMRRRRRHAA